MTPTPNILTKDKIINYLGYKERDFLVTDIRQFHYTTVKKASIYKDSEVANMHIEDTMRMFRKLQADGLGTFITGRHGEPTRFRWKYKPTSIVSHLNGNGKLEEFKPEAPVKLLKKRGRPKGSKNAVKLAAPNPAASKVVIIERPTLLSIAVGNRFVRVELPENFTDRDIKKVEAGIQFAMENAK